MQAAIGTEDIARGDLATVMGLPPQTAFQVQGISELTTPTAMADSVDQDIDRAFAQRPELLAQVARVRAANASIKQARSTYFPSLSLSAMAASPVPMDSRISFQGLMLRAKFGTLACSSSGRFSMVRAANMRQHRRRLKRERRLNIDALRDQVADEVWTAYSNMKTALRQQQAATTFLTASDQSYEAAREAYGYGVRNLLDVVSAQKTLAQARSEDVFARTQLLLQTVNLGFETGDLIEVQPPKVGP